MITLGIDPGTARMGWGIVKSEKLKGKRQKLAELQLVDYGCLETTKEEVMPARLWYLYKELRRLVKEYEPQEVVIERLFFNSNAKTVMAVGQARGVAMLASAEKKLPLFEYTALEAKFILTGYGRSEKDEVCAKVRQLLSIREKIKMDDAADALAIALCHLLKNGNLQPDQRKS